MEYRRLGKSGVQVSVLSFGSWITFGKQVDNKIAKDCMAFAYERGINFFDNAEVYSKGESEIVMGKILKEMKWSRDSYLISSKVYWGGDLPNQKGLSRKHIVEGCNASLKRMDVDYFDLFFCHRPDLYTPMEETVWSMHNLIQQGKILYWGTSEWTAQEIQEAITVARVNNLIPPMMEQPHYNMFHRKTFEVDYLKLFRDHGMGSTVWSPLASGLLTGKYADGIPKDSRLAMEGFDWLVEQTLNDERIAKVKELTKIAESIDSSITNVALAWCLKNPNVSTIILGASKLEQLEQNFGCLEVVELLSEEVMEQIEGVLDNKSEYPEY